MLGKLFASATRISIHALRVEGDMTIDRVRQSLGLFLSTPSVRRATPNLLAAAHDR